LAVLGDETVRSGARGYVPIGEPSAARVARTPVLMSAEEVA